MSVRMDSPESLSTPSSEQFDAKELQEILVDAGLIEDLEGEDGLVFPLPSEAQIVRIVRGYDTRESSGLKVRCSACKQHQPHNRGFRVELDDGNQARVGFNCGEGHFGEGAWKAAVADFDRRAENAIYVARIGPTLTAIEQILPLIDEWHGRTNQFGKWIVKFRKNVPALFRRLGEESKLRDGRLEKQKKIKTSGVDRNGREIQKTSFEAVSIGRIPFPGMFLGESPNHGLNAAKKSLGLAVALLEHRRDTSSLNRAFAHVRDARQYLAEANDVHAKILLNLNSDWVPALCKWANRDEKLHCEYESDGAAIIHSEFDYEEKFDFLEIKTFGFPSNEIIVSVWP